MNGFGDTTVKFYEIIRLIIELIFSLHLEVRVTRQLDFIVIDLPSTFNGFLGRPFEHEFGAATSTHFYCVKFTTSRVVGNLKSDQKMTRRCSFYIGSHLKFTFSFPCNQVFAIEEDRKHY